MTPSALLAQGLDLEEHQARLRMDVKNLSATPSETQTTRITERRTRLTRRITAWQAAQELLIPGVGLHRRRANPAANTLPEDIDLMLPSGLPSDTRLDRIDTTFYDYEWRLRTGQAHDNLSDLRRQLLIVSTMYQSKDRLIRGQQHNTRSATLINNIQSRIKFISNRYRANRVALLVLSEILGKTEWAATLLPLEDSDIHSLRGGDDASSSEGRRTLSWIWMAQRTNASEMTDTMGEGMSVFMSIKYVFDGFVCLSALRIEWCKSRARAHRWQEECILLKEEMRRITEFHTWQAQVWKTRADEEEVPSGACAYALRQMHSREQLTVTCTYTWRHIQEWMEMGEGVVAAGEPLVEASAHIGDELSVETGGRRSLMT